MATAVHDPLVDEAVARANTQAHSRDQLKRLAAERAVELISPGMVVGLGVGSTAIHAIRKIGALLADGELHNIIGIPCSHAVAAEASRLGISLSDLDEQPVVDLTIDGADEVDPQLNLIKGGGGALLREKMVAQASLREVIVVDEGKLSPQLGMLFALPVEVITFGWKSQARFLEQLGATVCLRRRFDGGPYLTDQNNYILDCTFGSINDPEALARRLEQRAGIVEHGLFLGLATDLIIAGTSGVRQMSVAR
ncbi:ribose-5-phosphate isomerase RpiA [Candidatus Chloroploca sp. M-50]|uniref:Ribose-5-phosphate isomerase A n=1 Tax=Candidatus Chloroploca mongolica TaxID=2528176 RepID=A0ABS4DF21_9CHLR|nr:ribose-5-phosphate isomerase RpiA [Candidatus Chloroploca mongolica]MBP1468032.1 ribose-5-phosphate isomerase RpiA [Candidatus Chloroploca mongolica]